MKARTPLEPLKFITRMDGERCWKLQLTASSSRYNTAVQLYFSDAQHGGEEDALAAAQEAREALRDRSRTYAHRKTTVVSAKRSLPAGVTRLIDRRCNAQGHIRYDLFWVASWMEPQKDGRMRPARKRFSVRAHGYEKSFEKARNLRAEKSGFDIREHSCPDISHVLADVEDAQMIISQVLAGKGPK